MHAQRKVLVIDRRQSKLAAQLHKQVAGRFHELQDRIHWKTADIRPVGTADPIALPDRSVVVACHACGLLSDEAIAAATFKSPGPPSPLAPSENSLHWEFHRSGSRQDRMG
mmetsp:Transcript_7351/g.8283  ORF Transcript_7351/g.8283 Transcript_7351/m.8283 type:complete len:111 (-) Transcript_7351:55-387(-)